MKYQQLLENYNNESEKIPYPELLDTEEWQEKRFQIIGRDESTCQNYSCNKKLTATEKSENVTILKISWHLDKNDKCYFKCEILYMKSNTNLGVTKTVILHEYDIAVKEVFKDISDFIEKHNLKENTTLPQGEEIIYYKKVLLPSNYVNNKDLFLHVHHEYYMKKHKSYKLPWEYNGEALITYCSDCHQEWHKNNKTKIYELDENGNKKEVEYIKCPKCEGVGWLPEFKHIARGICFDCWGRGCL